MVASGIATCRQESVRKFVVNMVRYLNAAGLPMAALDLADGVLAHWDAETAGDRPSAADCRLMMRTAKADALFAQGRRLEAVQLRQEVLDAMRSDPGQWTAEIINLESAGRRRWPASMAFSARIIRTREPPQRIRKSFSPA